MNDKILKHYKLIYIAMNKLHCNLQDEEEYFFYGLMGLYKGIQTYKPGKYKETTYYYACIKNEIMRYFGYKTRNKRNTYRHEISLNTPLDEKHTIEDVLVSDLNIEEDYIKKEQYELVVNTLNKMKDTKWKQYICEFYGIGQPAMNIKEMSLKYGIKPHAIQSSILQGIRKIRKRIEEKG